MDVSDCFKVGRLVGWLVVGHMGPGPIRGVLSVGIFLRDPSPYFGEFRRKPFKVGIRRQFDTRRGRRS